MVTAPLTRRGALATALAAPAILVGISATPASAAGRSGRELLQAFLDTLSAHDLTAFRALYVDDGYVQHQALVTNAPSAANGPDTAVAYFRTRIEAFPDLRVRSDVSLFEGNRIAANLIWSGTHEGAYLGVRATGRKVVFNSTDIMTTRDGLFSEHWGVADLYGLLAQLRA